MPSTKTKSNRRNRNPMKRLGIFQKKKQKPTPLSSQDKTGSVMSSSVENQNQNQKRVFSLNQIVDVGHDNDHDNHRDHDHDHEHAETSSNYVDEVDTDTDYRKNHDNYSDGDGDDDNEHAKENMNMARNRNRNRNRTLKNSKSKSKSGGGLFGRKSKQKKKQKQTKATTKRKGYGNGQGDADADENTMAQEASQFPIYYSGQNSRRNSEDVMQDDADVEGGVDLDVDPDAEIDLDNTDADADADTDIGLNHNGAMKMNMDVVGTLRTPSPKKKNKSPFRKKPKGKGNKSKSKTTSPTSTTANSPFASTLTSTSPSTSASTSQIKYTSNSNMNSFPASSRTRSSASRSISLSLSAGSKSTLTSSASASSARRKKSKLKLKPQGLRRLNTGTFGCHAWTLFCGPKIDIPTSTVDDGNGNGNGNGEGEGSVLEKLKHKQIVDQLKVRVDVHNLSLEDRNGNDNDYEYGDEYTFHSRSESGSKSYASTSENDLINDYDNENENENENNSLSSQDNRKNTDIMVLARSALSRPFGRTSLPAHLAKTWMVEVAFSGYDENLGECIYNIMVQKEDYHRDRDRAGTPAPSPSRNISLSLTSSFVAANVDRTLNDFLWLEEALREEFHGSLLFPMLSLALTSGTDWTTVSEDLFDRDRFERGEWDPMKLSMEIMEEALHSDEPVDTKVLSDWLSDILNSVRGKGELILNHKMVEVVQSESMESFLYKTAGPLPRPQRKDKLGGELGDGVSNWDLIGFGKSFDLDGGEGGIQSALAGIVKANLNCLGISEDDDYLTNGQNSSTRNLDDDHAGPLFHSDRILADRAKIYQKQESSQMLLWHKMLHSKELQAQRMYIAVQKENTLRAMYRLRMLLEKEILLSAAWKRFAISLSMLFAAEKDIENNKIGRSRSKISITLKNKIGRTKVDDHLRVLARQKQDRSIPSLKVLSGMLNAFYSDFSTVDPSLREYVQGLEMLIMSTDSDDSWQSHFKALSPINLLRSDSIPSTVGNAKIDKFAIQGRLNTNEEYMKSSLEQACMAIKIRVSRMSWKYFKMESGQVSLLLSAAEQARSNLKYTRSRSHTQIPSSLEEEKEDNEREIDLVRLIMELGLKKKYKYSPLPKSSSSSTASHTSSSSETSVISDVDHSPSLSLSLDDNETTTTGTFTDDGGTLQSPLLEPVMSMARGNAGRWNEDLAKSVLEASGIPSHSFDSDESLSTKNIRAVSKLVTSLRESVDRCQEAVNMLSEIEHNVSFCTCVCIKHMFKYLYMNYHTTSMNMNIYRCLTIYFSLVYLLFTITSSSCMYRSILYINSISISPWKEMLQMMARKKMRTMHHFTSYEIASWTT